MKTVEELEAAFSLYFTELDRCEGAKCYWALLHLAVVLPDVCAALEFGTATPVGVRYPKWCELHFPPNPKLMPHHRFQIRNALLHEGSTLPRDKVGQTNYRSISYVDPNATDKDIHLLVTPDGTNVALNVVKFVEETLGAVRHWFAGLQHDPDRNATVERNLPRLARRQMKTSVVQVTASEGSSASVHLRYPTDSSTGG